MLVTMRYSSTQCTKQNKCTVRVMCTIFAPYMRHEFQHS